MSDARPAVTIVGAGPTGLTLAVELLAAGVSFRIVDAAATSVHESRALAIQARTLEVLERSGIADLLVADGDPARVIEMHGTRDVTLPLFDGAKSRTRYPFLLFLSQARTEQILLEHLEQHGIRVERDTSLVGLTQDAKGVRLDVQAAAGRQSFETDYVVGCDGAHSAARILTGIPFTGSGFPQMFAIADLEVDGLEQGRVHAYVTSAGLMFFFPLGSPATWRLLVMLPPDLQNSDLDLSVLQLVVDEYAGASKLVLRDPAWVTRFQVQSRYAQRFRDRRVFLAGDAAHIHGPAGAQGMNTGIQDAANLGWKLAQVLSGQASDELLGSYEDERLPVARGVLRMTDRLFRMATTSNPLIRFVRPRVAPFALSVVTRSRLLRQLGSEWSRRSGSPTGTVDSPRTRAAFRSADCGPATVCRPCRSSSRERPSISGHGSVLRTASWP
ncbi:MAG: FAD-dependent monooxygenase [Pseudolysinimonas sp.]